MKTRQQEIEAENIKLADENANLRASNAELLAALQQFACCNLTDDNCASLDVASKRIRNIANIAIAKAEQP
jgi:hypothetical protein